MSMWRQIAFGLRNLLQRDGHARDIREEVEQYFEDAATELRASGLSAEEARRAVRLACGNSGAVAERVHAYGWESLMRTLSRDLRFAARQLLRNPGFTLTAILTLALGIGANTAIFTVVESVLLVPLPYPHADRLTVLQTHFSKSGRTTLRLAGPDAVDVRAQAHSFAAVSLYSGGSLGVQLRDHAVFTDVAAVDAEFPRVFDLHPVVGRVFTNSGSDRGVLVSEPFARDNFGSAQAALGQVLHIENEAVPILGVLPDSFQFPAKTQVWEAFPFHPAAESRTAFNYKAVARLRAGVPLQAAQSELDTITRRLQATNPSDDRDKQFRVTTLARALTGAARPTLLVLWATVGIILLIACVNVTHLQLVRAMERQHEIAIRKALGSSRGQVLLPVALESLLISMLGGAAGLLLAVPAVRVLVAMAPAELPRAHEIHLNGWVLAFTFLLAVLAAMAASVIPALRALHVDPAEALKQDASRGLSSKSIGSLRDGLMVAQIASTFLLAIVAGLLVRTMVVLQHRAMGFQTSHRLIVDADAPAHTQAEALHVVQQFDEIFNRIAHTPGVEGAAGIMGLPTGDYGSNGNYNVRGGLSMQPGQKPWSNFSVASPGYFQAMGIPLKRGRDFNAEDTFDAPFVAILSESVARQSFGNADPIGKQIQCGLDSPKWMTVIGVVGDVRQDSPAEKPGPNLYMPMAQHPFYANQIHIVVRTQVKPLSLMQTVRAQIARINPLIALRFTTMDDLLNQSTAAQRFRAVLMTGFAAVGFLLAMLGIYGTISYSVAQRRFEIGIRMAFGAGRSAILQGVLGHATRVALIGIAAGFALIVFLSHFLASMLVGVEPLDPFSLLAAALLLFCMALAAAFGPGWRATRVSPISALRAE